MTDRSEDSNKEGDAMREIAYINSKGQKIVLNQWPYSVKNINAQNWEREYDFSDIDTNGTLGNESYGDTFEFRVTITVRSRGNERQKISDINHVYNVIGYDSENGKTGRLYIGSEYLNCIFRSSKKRTNRDLKNALDIEMIGVSVTKAWIEEKTYQFNSSRQTNTRQSQVDYPHDYPYDYMSRLSVSHVNNTHFSECDFLLTIYGPCINPKIHIGGHVYEVYTTLDAGEYLKINSLKNVRTIQQIEKDGTIVNVFSDRNFDSYIFEKIKPGISVVSWDGTFGFDITLYVGRGEPSYGLYSG